MLECKYMTLYIVLYFVNLSDIMPLRLKLFYMANSKIVTYGARDSHESVCIRIIFSRIFSLTFSDVLN